MIARAVSHDRSLLVPLQTVLGLEDLYDLLEVLAVDAHNRRVVDRIRRAEEGR